MLLCPQDIIRGVPGYHNMVNVVKFPAVFNLPITCDQDRQNKLRKDQLRP